MDFVSSEGIEKLILLNIGKKSKSISEIAKNLDKATNTIGKYIERMELQKIIIRNQDYLNDSRKSQISINFERVKIKRADVYYLRYFLISLFSLIFSFIGTYFKKNLDFLFGGILGITFPMLYMIYMVFIEKDKIIVEKLVKSKKRETKKNPVDNEKPS